MFATCDYKNVFETFELCLDDDRPNQMRHWGEVKGTSNEVKVEDRFCTARIGKINIILPLEAAPILKKAESQHLSILRTHKDFRILLSASGNIDKDYKSNSLIIIQDTL